MDSREIFNRQRISRAEKEKNDFQWYKDKIIKLDSFSNRTVYGFGGVSEYHRMKVNYDLFNNILDVRDFEYVVKPFGAESGELPAKMVNRDILSNKIKAILGMEQRRGFDYRVFAVNADATTRREQEEFGRLRDFVVNTITAPIKQELELEAQQKMKGQELTEEEKQQIQAEIQEKLKAMTPDEVKLYMEREHQDPAEAMCSQLLTYLVQKTGAKRKFNSGCKHAAIAAKEIYWVGEVNGEPELRVCNPLRFNYDKSPDIEFIEQGEWATYEYRMSPSEVVSFFGDELTDSEIDSIYTEFASYIQDPNNYDLFDFSRQYNKEEKQTVRVFHATWRSLREVKFLTYIDENGEEQETIVDESYKMDKKAGDISLTSKWIPEVYEGYKIGASIFKKMRPIPGQFRDMDNLYYSPLPYKGAIYDITNSLPTSLMDRGKVWQYYINIIYYRLELMLASDKGKKLMMNINAIPDSAGIDIEKFQYFFESTPFGWFNPNEEGLQYSDINTLAKVVDLSMSSDIEKYVVLAEKMKSECGSAMGITPQVEGQISPNEAVGNTQQNLVQNSYVLETFFSLHNIVRANVLTSLIEVAKVCYSDNKPRKLSYVLDDMSLQTLNLDPALLDNTTLGIFVDDGGKAKEIKDMISTIAQSAVQNSQAKIADIISVLKQDSISVAEDILRKSQKEIQEEAVAAQKAQQESQEKIEQMKIANEEKKRQHEKELTILKEEERRKTVIAQASITGASFNPEQDADNDGVNDFLEIAKHGLNAEIQKSKLELEKQKLDAKKKYDTQKLELEKRKLAQQQQKSTK